MTRVQDLPPEVVAELSPGVRDLVVWLRRHGFETTDSGDGSSHATGMECALPFPHVVMTVHPNVMILRAVALQTLLEGAGVDFGDEDKTVTLEATYSPTDGVGTLFLGYVTSDDVRTALMPPPTTRNVANLTTLELVEEVDSLLHLGDQWYAIKEKAAGGVYGIWDGDDFGRHPKVKRYGELCAELMDRIQAEGLRS